MGKNVDFAYGNPEKYSWPESSRCNWKPVAFTIIIMTLATADSSTRPPICDVTVVYMCRERASDYDSPESLWQALQITNTTVCTGKDTKIQTQALTMPLKPEPKIYEIGPCVVRNVGHL